MADAFLDTTFFIDLHRGDRAAARLWIDIVDGDVSGAFSAVTAFELWLGRHVTPADEAFYRSLFFFLEEVPVTFPSATQAATWLRGLPDHVSERLIRDALIAASATERGEPVYTRNVRDFRRFTSNVSRY